MEALIKYSRMINMKGAGDYQCRLCTALWGTVCVFLPLTCPGWCWWCWFCQHRWRSWSGSRSHGRSAEPHLPARKHRQTQISFSVGRFFSFFKTAAKQLGVLIFTFCLLSSLGTCRTNTPSLRELTEMPANTAQQLVAVFFSKCQSLFQIMWQTPAKRQEDTRSVCLFLTSDLSECRSQCVAWACPPLQ